MCTCSHFPEGKIGANSDPMGQLDTVTHKNGIIRSNSVAGSTHTKIVKGRLIFCKKNVLNFVHWLQLAVERNEIYLL